MTTSYRLLRRFLLAVTASIQILAGTTLTFAEATTDGKLLIPPNIENVLTQMGDGGNLRAIVRRDEIYIFLTIEFFHRGGEGEPPRLIWKNEVSNFGGNKDFVPDLIEDLFWDVDTLKFTVTWYDGKRIHTRDCRLKAKPKAKLACNE
jgi:hypothetical protein